MRDREFGEAEYRIKGQELITLQRLGTHHHKVTLALMYQAKYSRYFASVLQEFLVLNGWLAFCHNHRQHHVYHIIFDCEMKKDCVT